MSRLVSLVPLVLLSAVALGDSANEREPAKPVVTAQPAVAAFTTLDRNADHRLSRSEAGFDHVLSRVFADADTDGDGYVTQAEYAALEKEYNLASR